MAIGCLEMVERSVPRGCRAGSRATQRANAIQVAGAAGNVIANDDSAVQTRSYGYDPFGNRTTTTLTDGSDILVRYDDFGRQTAELQQIEGLYLVDWSAAANAFLVSGWDTSPRWVAQVRITV